MAAVDEGAEPLSGESSHGSDSNEALSAAVEIDRERLLETPSLTPETGVLDEIPLSAAGDAAETESDRASLNSAAKAIELLTTEVARFHERALGYEANARQLHSRVEELQQDQVRVLLKPIFERLATLHAQANDIAAQRLNDSPDVAGDFLFFANSIEEALALYDLDSIQAEAGMPFDAKQQQAVRVVKTDQQDLDGTLQRVVRQGFIFASAERVLLPARVAVFRYEEPNETGQAEEK